MKPSQSRALLSLLSVFYLCACFADSVEIYPGNAFTQFREPGYRDIIPADPAFREMDAYALGLQAFIYGYVAVEEYRTMIEMVQDKASPQFVGFNRFNHGRRLATPDYAAFKSPNSDTLYSNAWLDLSREPVVLSVPDTKGRYYTANFLDMFSNASNIGRRTYGTGKGKFLIIPPGWNGSLPEGLEPFFVSTRYMWILLRILVDGPDDLAAAHQLQDSFSITPLSVYLGGKPTAHNPLPEAPRVSASPEPIDFFRILNDALNHGGILPGDTGLVTSFQRIGIVLGQPFNRDALHAETLKGLERAYTDGLRMLNTTKSQIGKTVNGWSAADIAMYGFNYLHRSSVNSLGLGANVKEENFAFTTFVDSEGQPLDGGKSAYHIRFAAGEKPPVDGFWSLTLYAVASQQLIENPINRYAIGDRTETLKPNPDGSLDVWVQADEPPADKVGNWLPAPAEPFYIVLRAYEPRANLLSGEWTPPYIERALSEESP